MLHKILLLISLLLISIVSRTQVENGIHKEFKSISSRINQKDFSKFVLQSLRLDRRELTDSEVNFITQHLPEDENYPEIYFRLGRIYIDKNNQKSYSYFLKSLKSTPDLMDTTVKYLPEFHEKIALIYFYFQRFEESLFHLNSIFSFKNLPSRTYINTYNTIGLIHKITGNLEKSLYYSRKALQIAKQAKDEEWIGVLSGNIGNIEFKKGNFTKAKNLILIDIDISKKFNSKENELRTLTTLVLIYFQLDELEKIPAQIARMDKLFSEEFSVPTKISYFDAKSNYLEQFGHYQQSLENYKIARAYMDTNIINRDELAIRNFEFQFDFQEKQAEISILNEKEKSYKIKMFGLILLVFFLTFISGIIIHQIRKKRKKIENNLNSLEFEMRELLGKLIKKNAIVEKLKIEIDTINTDKISEEDQDGLLTSLKSFTILTNEDWLTFKKMFEEWNPEFMKFFKENHPEVTTSELRLAALILLNLSNQEISNVLGISPDSVRKTSLRLRKKLYLQSNDELVTFVHSI